MTSGRIPIAVRKRVVSKMPIGVPLTAEEVASITGMSIGAQYRVLLSASIDGLLVRHTSIVNRSFETRFTRPPGMSARPTIREPVVAKKKAKRLTPRMQSIVDALKTLKSATSDELARAVGVSTQRMRDCLLELRRKHRAVRIRAWILHESGRIMIPVYGLGSSPDAARPPMPKRPKRHAAPDWEAAIRAGIVTCVPQSGPIVRTQFAGGVNPWLKMGGRRRA